MTRISVGILASVAFATGCSGFINDQAATSTSRILEQSSVASRRLADVQLAREALPGGIVQLEAFALAYPDHDEFKRMHADAYCQYAVAFVFDDWEDAKLAARDAQAESIAGRLRPLLAQCAQLERALLPRNWRDANAKGAEGLPALLPMATRAEVGPLLWVATTDAVLIALDPMRNVTRLPGVEALLARCMEIAPGFHDADAEILAATLESGRGAVFGDTDGQTAFDRARMRAGDGALIVDVMYARGTAVARKDHALFVATLERVLATDVERWPERRLANEIARQKARRYLAAAAVLIP